MRSQPCGPIHSRARLRFRLLSWFDRRSRDFAWRGVRRPVARFAKSRYNGLRDPYAIWISEVMLQQTRAIVVVPYFQRWMSALPTIHHLARASEQRVLRLWSGLGYYRRARALRQAAQLVVRHYAGVLPKGEAELLNLPGIGRYTAGAIRSIAFGQRAAVVDGNVTRVLCRVWGIAESPRQAEVKARLWALAQELVSPSRPGDFNEALMELGATVCTPRHPRCDECCWRTMCVACATHQQAVIPPPTRSQMAVSAEVACLVTEGKRWLVVQRADNELCMGCWEFPRVALQRSHIAAARLWLRTQLGARRAECRALSSITAHVLDRRQEITPVLCRLPSATVVADIARARWVTLTQARRLPCSSPQRKMLNLLAQGADSSVHQYQQSRARKGGK